MHGDACRSGSAGSLNRTRCCGGTGLTLQRRSAATPTPCASSSPGPSPACARNCSMRRPKMFAETPSRTDQGPERAPSTLKKHTSDGPDAPTLEYLSEKDASLHVGELLERLLASLRQDWQHGEQRKARFYLDQFPAVADDVQAGADLVFQEVLLGQRAGVLR